MSDSSDAIRNRLAIIRTTNKSVEMRPKFDEEGQIIKGEAPVRDGELGNKLCTKEEYEGLFNLLVKNLNNIMKRGEYIFSEKHREEVSAALPEFDLMDMVMQSGIFEPVEEKDMRKQGLQSADFVEIVKQWLQLPGNLLRASDKFKTAEGISREYAEFARRVGDIPKAVRATKAHHITKKRAYIYPFKLNKQVWHEVQEKLGSRKDRDPTGGMTQEQMDDLPY